MTGFVLELQQLIKALFPLLSETVPNKANFVQSCKSF